MCCCNASVGCTAIAARVQPGHEHEVYAASALLCGRDDPTEEDYLDQLARALGLSEDEAIETARFIWREINGKNLRENIAPTKRRASLLLRKGADHRVTDVSLTRL